MKDLTRNYPDIEKASNNVGENIYRDFVIVWDHRPDFMSIRILPI